MVPNIYQYLNLKLTLIVRPPIIVSSYSSPREKVLDELVIRVVVFTVHLSSFLEISIVGDDAVIIFLATHGIPIDYIPKTKGFLLQANWLTHETVMK